MGCGCGGSSRPSFPENRKVNIPQTPAANPAPSGTDNVSTNVVSNLVKAFVHQPDKLQWIKEGTKGILKCLGEVTIYTEEQIAKNRDVCRECPHSTKKDGKLITTSQCMAPDPKRGGVPCGCFIMCKTQSDNCPLNKWVHLTISSK